MLCIFGPIKEVKKLRFQTPHPPPQETRSNARDEGPAVLLPLLAPQGSWSGLDLTPLVAQGG
jgi:hypothetical protein